MEVSGMADGDAQAHRRQQRRELLASLIESRSTLDRGRIQPRPAGQHRCRVSPAQQRVWFLDQFHAGSALHNIPNAMRFRGPLRLDALVEAFNDVIRRHETLRTLFESEAGEIYQKVLPELRLQADVIDLGGPDAPLAWQRVHDLVGTLSQLPFDLRAGPLIRLHVLRLGEADHVVLMTVHHIIFDAWSTGVITRDLLASYDAVVAGRSSPHRALGVQYADFACWQIARLEGQGLGRQLNYWRRELEGLPASLDLPVDLHAADIHDQAGAVLPFSVPGALTARLKALAAERDATMFMLLLAAFMVLMYRYTGQTDLCVGVPIAGRGRIELEPMVGLFTNVLVVRVGLEPDCTFDALLDRVREKALNAFDNQEVPFEKLIELAGTDRDSMLSPLFQVSFSMQNSSADVPGSQGRDLLVEQVEWYGNRYARYPISLFMQEHGNDLIGAFEYRSGLFHPQTIERMRANFLVLLGSIGDDASRPAAVARRG